MLERPNQAATWPHSGSAATPTRLVNGFTSTLPGRSRLFFFRQYFVTYPRPIQPAGVAPFPRDVPLLRIEAPARQSIVVRTVEFNAYQHSGIGIEDLAVVPRGRTIGTLGFGFKIDNRSVLDFSTNLTTAGTPINLSPAQLGISTGPRGTGLFFNGTGPAVPSMPGETFATYARPGAPIEATVRIYRPPSYDLRLFSIQLSGWLAEAKELETILDMLSR